MINLDTGETYSTAVTLIMIAVIAAALLIALNMRKKIEKNEDRGGLLFTPEKLRIEPVEEIEAEDITGEGIDAEEDDAGEYNADEEEEDSREV